MIRFSVRGTPKPKGSKRAFVVRTKAGLHRAALAESAGAPLVEWLERVRSAAREVQPDAPLTGAVRVDLRFLLARPKGHTGARGLRPSAPHEHTGAPDLDKLVRAVLDALIGVLFVDDSQVTGLFASKGYSSASAPTGVEVVVWQERGDPALAAPCTHAPQNDRTDPEAPASILRAPRALPGHADSA